MSRNLGTAPIAKHTSTAWVAFTELRRDSQADWKMCLGEMFSLLKVLFRRIISVHPGSLPGHSLSPWVTVVVQSSPGRWQLKGSSSLFPSVSSNYRIWWIELTYLPLFSHTHVGHFQHIATTSYAHYLLRGVVQTRLALWIRKALQ